MIISGGVNIYPAEIEGEIITCPAVDDVAVFGIPHDDWGEEIKAVVQKTDPAADDDAVRAEIMGFISERLGKFKQPKSIDFIDEMPRDPSGKLFKRRLRDPYWEGRDRAI
jgi:long-chain acyl-CoA synthetase